MTASTGTVWAAAGLNLAVTLAVGTMAWTAMTTQTTMSNDLGKQTSGIGFIMDDQKTMKASLEDIQNSIKSVRDEMRTASLNIGQILASAGVPVDGDIEWKSVDQQVVAFPLNAAAVQSLMDRGFTSVKLTPAIDGYVPDSATALVVEQVISKSLAEREKPLTGDYVIKNNLSDQSSVTR